LGEDDLAIVTIGIILNDFVHVPAKLPPDLIIFDGYPAPVMVYLNRN
jgi:hypothetical protein